MTLYQLKSVFAKTLSYLTNVESITKTTCYPIRGVLLKQAQAFLDRFHKQRVLALTRSLEADRWAAVRFDALILSLSLSFCLCVRFGLVAMLRPDG